ncbi:MAG: rhomboid family intramembrane serine protease [Pseudomonadota bacterium]
MEQPGVNALDNLSAQRADLIKLVLESQGIDAKVAGSDTGYAVILDDPMSQDRALAAIRAFDRENVNFPKKTSPFPELPLNPSWCIMIAVLLLAVHAGGAYWGIHEDMIHRFGSSALHIFQGEIYRAFTALLIHDDLGHLAGNVAGLLAFGIPLLSIAGCWTGLFILAGSGTAGNLLTALMYRNAHLAIGTSTSVMGAAGALVAFQMQHRFLVGGIRPGILVPLGAGVALLGMLSGGERTDIAAHGFGFVAGFVLGLLVCLGRRSTKGG